MTIVSASAPLKTKQISAQFLRLPTVLRLAVVALHPVAPTHLVKCHATIWLQAEHHVTGLNLRLEVLTSGVVQVVPLDARCLLLCEAVSVVRQELGEGLDALRMSSRLPSCLIAWHPSRVHVLEVHSRLAEGALWVFSARERGPQLVHGAIIAQQLATRAIRTR